MDLQTVLTALRNADAAGDTQAAQRLARIAQSMQGATQEDDIESRLKQLYAEREELLKPKTTIGGGIKEFGKGIVPGAINLLETAGTGIASMLPDSTEKAAREKIKELAGIAKKPFEAAPGYEDSVLRKLGEGLGSTGPFFALGPLGLAGRAVGSGLGVAAGAGEARESAEAKGATESERRAATLLGAPTGLLDMLAPQIKAIKGIDISRKTADGVTETITKELSPFKSLLLTAGARGGVEGLTEAAQKVAQNLIAKGVYDPSQEILVGSGEEGAYGAGVGALASLIVDMTIGRKARRSQLGLDKEAPAPAPEPKTPEQQLLGYTAEPFTPVIMPDGSVATTKAEYDSYVKSKEGTARERAEDQRTSDPMAGVPSDMRDLARRGKEAALAETFGQEMEPGQAGLPGIERADGTVEVPGRGRVKGTAQEEAIAEPAEEMTTKRQTVMINGKPTVVETQVPAPRKSGDTRTQDMIDELETANTERMVGEDTSAELRKLIAGEQDKVEKIRREASTKRYNKEQVEQTKRLDLLLPIIESEVKDIPKVFVLKLKRAGFNNPTLTEREEKLINRAYDIRLAEEPIAEKAPEAFSKEELEGQQTTSPTSAQASKLPAMWEDIVEGASFENRQKRIDAQIATEKAKAVPDIGKIADLQETKADQIAVEGLRKVTRPAANDSAPTAKTEAKKGSQDADTSKSSAKPSGDGGRDKNAGDVAGGTGTRTEDRKEGGGKDERTGAATDTKRVEAPKSTGLGDSGKPAGGAGSGTSVESGSLKKTEPTSEEDNAKLKQLIGAVNRAKKQLLEDENLESDDPKLLATRERLAKAKAEYQQFSPEIYARDLARAKKFNEQFEVRQAEKAKADEAAKAKTGKPKKAAPAPNFGAYGQVMETESLSDALDYLAYDVYIAMFDNFTSVRRLSKLNEQLRAGQIPEEIAFGRAGSDWNSLAGGKYAKAFYESLTPAGKQALARKMLEQFDAYEAELRRDAKEQMDGDQLELARDAVALGMPMHPAVLKALKAGNLQEALTMMGAQGLGRTSGIAKKLAGAIGKTKVKLVTGLKNDAGEPVAGLYDPKTDTITLDADAGMNAHVLLHEAVHAATSHVIDNKSHPVTKQLTELYNNVKDSLGTAYGAQSLDEFVAEAFSNPEFQQTLSAINPKGEAITAWQRFTHAIRNFVRSLMGKDTKGLGTALDVSDSLINSILSPAPESRGAGSLYSASLLGKGAEVFKSIDNRILSMPMMSNDTIARIYDMVRNAPQSVSKIILRSQPLNVLTEVAKKDIPMAPKLNELERLWNGAKDKRMRETNATMSRIQNWVKGNPEKEVILNGVIATSTLDQVDPSKTRDSYKGQQSESGANKQEVWDKLQVEWAKLGPEGQSIYKQMRDTYKKMYNDLLDLLMKRIDDSVENKEDAKKLRTEIYARLATKGKIEPYFPLTRSGDFRISYDLKGEHYVEHFDTSVARERAVKELEADGGVKNLQRFKGGSNKTYKDAPSTSFVNSILRTLSANNVNPEVTDEIMRTFLSTLPESSFAQAFRARKNTPGFSFNATGAFYSRSMSMAHQLPNMEYSAKAYKLRDEIDAYKKTMGDERIDLVADELNNHIQSLVSPNIAPWSKAVTSLAFGWTLGFNVSSAIVQTAQLPLVIAPYLGGKYGYPETLKAIGSATKIFMGSGRKRMVKMTVPTADGQQTIEQTGGFSLDNYRYHDFDTEVAEFTKKNGRAPKRDEQVKMAEKLGMSSAVLDLKELSEIADKYGLLDRSMTSDLLEMNEKASPLDRINAYSGLLFHHGERMNRQISLIAAYNLELGRMTKEGKTIDAAARTDAAKRAVEIAELMNGGASAGSAPLLAKSSLGKVMFMYKRYGVTMYYMMFKTAREAMKSEDEKVRKAAMRQIAGIYASAGLMAGVQGLPMFGIAAAVYNLLKGDDEDDMETAARKYFKEGMFNGAVNYFTGTAVANRIGLSDLLINSTGYKEQDNKILSFLQLVGGPAYGVADRLQQGAKLITEGETLRGLERMAPSGVSNIMKGIRFETEGANTLRGDPIVGDMSTGSAFAQLLGFAPAEYTRQLEINASAKNIEKRAQKERTKLLRDYYIAARVGDSEGMSDAIDGMLKFSGRHPRFGITADTIKNSMAQHMKTSREMYHGVTLNKNLRSELLEHASEFDGDFFE